MKHISTAFLMIGLGVAACAPLNTYYRPGATVDTVKRETTSCDVKALRDVPASTQVKRLPPEYVPPVRRCNAKKECQIIRAGHYLPGKMVTFDPNDGLRDRVKEQCMADKGFAPVSIPPCPDSVKRSAPARATTVLPELTSKSCVIRNKGGSFQIVTRG